jgi:hypothetical protein
MSEITEIAKLEMFLIKNSNINKKFIIDFFGFQKKNSYIKYKPFIIDLDDVAYWLGAVKGNLKDTLIEAYNETTDYMIIKTSLLLLKKKQANKIPRENNLGGHNKETILLTPDCFKMLCLRSKTKKADLVRKYYIELEKLIDEYKDIMILNLDKKIKLLENDLRKDTSATGKYCYIFEETDQFGETYYRLGQSGNIKMRMNNHNSSSIHKKVISYKIKTPNILHFESCLRGVIYDFRYKNNKDYFKISKNKIEEAINNCGNIVKKFKNTSKQLGGGNTIDDNYMKKINTDIKILFSELSESVRWNLFDSYDDGYYKGKKMSKKHLQKIILPKTETNKILIVDCSRDYKFNETINLGYESITYENLFKILYNFYNKEELSLDYLQKIPNDIWDYVKDAIKKKKKGDKIYRIDLVGNLCRFENVYLLDKENSIYKLLLGS